MLYNPLEEFTDCVLGNFSDAPDQSGFGRPDREVLVRISLTYIRFFRFNSRALYTQLILTNDCVHGPRIFLGNTHHLQRLGHTFLPSSGIQSCRCGRSVSYGHGSAWWRIHLVGQEIYYSMQIVVLKRLLPRLS